MKSKEKACDSQISDEIIQCPKYNFHFLGGKESAYQCTRRGFNPGVRRSPGKGNGNLQLTPVFLPGESQGQSSLVGCSPWGCKELDMPKRWGIHTHTHTHTLYKKEEVRWKQH